MDMTQIIIMGGTLVAFVVLGFMMSKSISKHESNKQKTKVKKGRTKYMPEVKNPGR